MTAGSPGRPFAPEPVPIRDSNSLDDVAVAVVGCGLHSTTAILPSLRHAPARLVAVCDLDADRAEFARRRFGAEAAYHSLDDLLARSDIEAVIVVGPPELHISAGIAAVESGRHVFIEKPPGNSLADAERLQSAARAAGRQVQIGFNKRRASAYRLAKQLTSEPEFGTVTSLDMTYAHWPVSGLRLHLVDMSIHALDTVRWLLGDPMRLTAYKRQIGDSHALALMLEHHPAAVSRLDLSAFQPGVQERLLITGEEAVVRVDGLVELTYVSRASRGPGQQPLDQLVESRVLASRQAERHADRDGLWDRADRVRRGGSAGRRGQPLDS
jgi:predicted dehydrogenase